MRLALALALTSAGAGMDTGTVSLTSFGAIDGNASSVDAAIARASDALNSGRYTSLFIPPGHWPHTTGGVLRVGSRRIYGAGYQSWLENLGEGATWLVEADDEHAGAEGIRFDSMRISGTRTDYNAAPTNQNAIEIGYLGPADGASKCLLFAVYADHMMGRGFSYGFPVDLAGPCIVACRADVCGYGFYAACAANHVDCIALGCNVSLEVASGNVFWTGGDILLGKNGVHIQAGGNDAHGAVSDAKIRHMAGYAVRSEAIRNGFAFDNVWIYEAAIEHIGGADPAKSLFAYCGCTLDPTTILFDGCYVQFAGGTRADTAYFVSKTEANSPTVLYTDIHPMRPGQVIPWVP